MKKIVSFFNTDSSPFVREFVLDKIQNFEDFQHYPKYDDHFLTVFEKDKNGFKCRLELRDRNFFVFSQGFDKEILNSFHIALKKLKKIYEKKRDKTICNGTRVRFRKSKSFSLAS